jgi:hypothetical protein
MKKKNIEKIFQEKLSDYSQLPEEQVWDNIAASLDQKRKKRRILPVWWQIGGVAAILLIGLFLFLPQEDLTPTNEIITDIRKADDEDNSVDINKVIDGQAETKVFKSKKADKAVIDESDNDSDERLVSEKTAVDKNKITSGSKELIQQDKSTVIANRSPLNRKKQKTVGIKENGNKNLPENTDNLAQNEAISIEKDDEKLMGDPEKIPSGLNNKSLAGTNLTEPQTEETIETKQKDENKTSIFDAIAAQEDTSEKDNSTSKWAVGPRVAPVFFSSLSQGSPIHSSFQNNAKSGNVNLSYGLAVTYNINRKLRLRSGVHKVDFGYDTKDVSFSSSLNGATNGIIDNIDYSLSSRNLVVRSNTRSGKIASENAQDVSGPDPSLNGKMIQEFGYLEVPLELTYQIFDKRFGVNVIGGISSLFLVNNSVTLQSTGIATEMGEANNLNDLNMSTNFGIGVSYQLNNSLQLSLEPMFKYQLNTFSEAAGNFQPFSMGVYSGINFKF